MSFIRTRIIKNRRYRYRETRWREGGRVRSRSEYLGPENGISTGGGDGNGGGAGFLRRQFTGAGGLDWDAIEKKMLEQIKVQDKAREEKLSELHEKFGLVIGPAAPVPIDKPATGVISAVDPEAKESPAEAGPADAPSEVSK
jgi:hypothetical protein